MGPQTLQAGQHVAVLGQFHLGFGVGGLGPHGEDVEYERGAVQYLHLQLCFYVAYLLGGQLIVEYHHAHLALGLFLGLYVVAYLLQLALAHIGHRAWTCHALREALHGHSACGVGQKFQLVEILFRLFLILIFRDKSHQHGGLCFHFRYNKFFHSVSFAVNGARGLVLFYKFDCKFRQKS